MLGSAAFRTGIAPSGALAGPWVRNPLWTLARAVPSLDLRFADNKSLVDATTGASLVTFTRASTGTYVGSDGVLQTASTDVPRFDHNPTTGESLGLLVEEARTNLLLNSATLSTQSVTVAAAANTLSFYGTGTVTLTGVSTAGPLVGTGANNRVSLTFTPTVGVLVVTVSGSVTNAQLEAGAFATSYIPTTSATVTRAADVASITGTSFSSWYNQTEGTSLIELREVDRTGSRTPRSFSDGTASNRIDAFFTSSLTVSTRLLVSGSAYNPGNLTLLAAGTVNKHVISMATGSAISVANGTLSTESTPPSLPVVNRLVIGADSIGGTPFTGTIKRLTYWPVRLANPTLQSITTP